MRTPTNTLALGRVADGLGLLGAAACALHCLALPVFLVLGSAVPTVFFFDESFHRMVLWLVVPSALVAFTLGCRRHRDRRVLVLGTLGVVGLVLAGTVLHELLGETGEKGATLVAAALLITAHLRNFRLCRSAVCDHEAVS